MQLSNNRELSYTVLFLAALSLVLATIDASIPKPIPFLRIGLANLPILIALIMLPAEDYFTLVLIKSLGMSIIAGTLFSYVALFSLAGSFASAIIMWVLYKIFTKHIGFLGLALAGALASNSTQLILARYFVFGSSVRFMIPLFLFAGLGSGILLGIFALQFAKQSQWLKRFSEQHIQRTQSPQTITNISTILQEQPGKPLSVLQILSLIIMAAVILGNTLPLAMGGFIAAWTIALIKTKREQKRTPSLIMPVLVITGITLAHILVPRGRILMNIIGIPITEQALIAGLKSGFFLEALIILSKNTIDSNLKFPGRLGNTLAQIINLYKLFFSIKPSIKSKAIIASIDEYLLTIETHYEPHSLTHYTDNYIIR
ncbi:MAG TPA: Gx transporter family protein [Spirochaetales bacterium]|nr:Gx transporter family protein [Spirochaetales bacterium]